MEKTSSISNTMLKQMEVVASKLSASAEDPSSDYGEQFPIIRQAELSRVLPKFSTILGNSPEEGVKMTDLDQIQHEFERLLSTCCVRQRALLSELESMDKMDDKKDRRGGGKSHARASTMKKKKVDDAKVVYKNPRNLSRILKIKHNQPPVNNTETIVPLPKHDTSCRFWLSVDAYCQDVTKDNLVFLDELMKECYQEIDVKIPALGEHYAMEWSDNGIQDEQNNGCIIADSLLEEKQDTSLLLSTVLKKFKSGDYMKGVNGIKGWLCLENRMRKEGLLESDDFSKSSQRDDEILSEIQKCQKELEAVNQHNLTELDKLRTAVRKDLHKQEVKTSLEKVDRDILAIYNKVMNAREQKQDISQYEQEANALILHQVNLNTKLNAFADSTAPSE